MSMRRILSLLLVVGPSVLALAADEAPKPAEPGTLVLIDSAGREQKLKAWKFAEGVRRLGWLAQSTEPKTAPEKGEKDTPRAKRGAPTEKGPEALVLRAETAEGLYREGALTLIPFNRLRALNYDKEQNTVTALTDAEEKIIGTTKFKGINKLVIEADVDRGELGVAEVKYLGGVEGGIRGVRFPAPKAAPPAAEGRQAVVVSAEGKSKKATHKVVDLSPLYRLPDGGEKLLPTLQFKKTFKVDVSKIKKITVPDESDAWQLTLKDGGDETLTLLETIPYEGKQARLLGLVGRVPAGFKLFPTACIAEITFDAEEK